MRRELVGIMLLMIFAGVFVLIQERETNMQINLNRHRSILRSAVLALVMLLGMGTYVAIAQKKPDESIIVDPYNTKRKAQPTPPVSAKPTPGDSEYNRIPRVLASSSIPARQVVGSCNTTQGCKALKNVCETLPKHAFATNEEGNDGVCADTTRNSSTGAWFLRNSNSPGATSNAGENIVGIDVRPGNNQAQGKRQYDPIVISKRVDSARPSLNCEGAAICRKVQNVCATLGGTYQRRNDVSGSCRH